MFKTLISAAVLTFAASPALAQNEMAPALGRLSEWSDAPVKSNRSVVFTAIGTYRDEGKLRLIDVRSDADSDGDGAMDLGVLNVTCNGGDALSGIFTLGGAAANAQRKPKLVQADESSALAAGKTLKARWGAGATGPARPVTLGVGQANVCAGLG
jgi:hypothetical protein